MELQIVFVLFKAQGPVLNFYARAPEFGRPGVRMGVWAAGCFGSKLPSGNVSIKFFVELLVNVHPSHGCISGDTIESVGTFMDVVLIVVLSECTEVVLDFLWVPGSEFAHRGRKDGRVDAKKCAGVKIYEDAAMVARDAMFVWEVATASDGMTEIVRDKNVVYPAVPALISDNRVVMELWRKVGVAIVKSINKSEVLERVPEMRS